MMSLRYGFFAVVAFLALGVSALSVGTASADRSVIQQSSSYVAIDDGGGVDPRGAGDLTAVVGEEKACEHGKTSTTCVWKGWLMAGVCLTFGGDIAAGDPGGVFLCEFDKD